MTDAPRPQRGHYPFPLVIPKHPAGEAPPACEEVRWGQARTFVDVPGFADGIYRCEPGGSTWVAIASLGHTHAFPSAPAFSDFSNAGHDHGDADDGGVLVVEALSGIGRDQAATLAGDAFTLDHGWIATVVLDTEGGAAADALTTINGGAAGQVIVLGQAASARDVTVTEGGNIQLSGAGSFNIDTSLATITLALRAAGGDWREVARSVNP